MGILFVFFAQSVFANAWTSQWILIFSPFWISSVTMILLLWFGNLTKSPLVLVCGSLVYAYNWMTIQYTGTHVLMYPYAIMPLALLVMVRISTRIGSWYTNAVALSLSFFVGTLFYTVAGLSYMLPLFISSFIFWLLISEKSKGKILAGVATLVSGFLMYVVESFGFTVPVLAGLLNLGILGYSASAKLVVPVSNFITYLGPQYFDTYFPSALSPLLVLAPETQGTLWMVGLVIPLIAILPLLSKKREIKALSIGLWTVFLLSLLMISLIKMESPYVQFIYGSLPLIWPINSADVYLMIFAGIIAILFSLGLETLRDWLSRSFNITYPKYLQGILLISLFAVSGVATGSSVLVTVRSCCTPSPFPTEKLEMSFHHP